MSLIAFNTLFQDALVTMGVLDPDDTPSTTQSDYGFRTANRLIENLSLERLNIVQILKATGALTSGVAAYTFGSGGTFGSTRYVKLTGAGILAPNAGGSGTLRSPVTLITEQQFNAIPEKTTAAVRPTLLYYDNASPVATGNLFPTPVFSGAVSLEVEAWQVLNSFPDKTTAVDFAYGYERALLYLLAKDLLSGFSVPEEKVPTILSGADNALAALRALNASLPGQPPPGGPLNAIPPAQPPPQAGG